MGCLVKDVFKRCLVLVAIAVASSAQGATIRTTDYITSPDHFNGFESALGTISFGSPYTEGGVTVAQVSGDLNGIWTTFSWGAEGNRSWYPNAGDFGYTSVALQGGGPIADVGFLVGSGFASTNSLMLYYELALNGVPVQAGSLAHSSSAHWLGFSGGGFDEIRLRDGVGSISSLSGGLNALAIDSIKLVTPVPEPEIYAMLAAGLGFLGFLKRRRASGKS